MNKADFKKWTKNHYTKKERELLNEGLAPSAKMINQFATDFAEKEAIEFGKYLWKFQKTGTPDGDFYIVDIPTSDGNYVTQYYDENAMYQKFKDENTTK